VFWRRHGIHLSLSLSLSLFCRKADPNATGKIGPLAEKMASTIMGIQYGDIPSEWSVKVE
jgi:hypothetical protein